MLKVVRSMKELPFGQLMQVCSETYDVRSEQDFYYYLRDCFFQTSGSMYCLWIVHEKPVSALRLEPWKDGVLLTGLETAPELRNRGYACALIKAVQSFLEAQKTLRIYAHIDKKNAASIHTHGKCGFRQIADTAAYLDGSVDSRAATYMYD